MTGQKDIYDKISEISRKRGIFWPSFEIYGGVAGFYDFGPVGTLLKRNIMNQWLLYFVYSQDNIIEIDTPIVNPRIIFRASGHEEHFTDPVLECSKCSRIYRADHLIKELLGLNIEGWSLTEINSLVKEKNLKCPECSGEFKPAFNTLLLFSTQIGPYKGEQAYLRPENAQGMFINFPYLLKITGDKLPLGIAQIGKVTRNEISPRQSLLRLREFTIMEVEFFFDPEEATKEVNNILGDLENEKLLVVTAEMRRKNIEEPVKFTVKELIEKNITETPWLAYWMGIGNRFIKSLGIPVDKTRFLEKLQHERAHYAAQAFDQEIYTSRYGWVEVAGYAYRTSYDIERHAQFSNSDFTYFKKYTEPVTVIVKKAYPNPQSIKKLVDSSKLPSIMKKLAELEPTNLYAELESKGYVEIEGEKLPQECFFVKESEEKIHGKRIYPHVVEPSYGLERLVYVILEYSYLERDEKNVLKLPAYIAPYHVAVFPLLVSKKTEHLKMIEISKKIYKELVKYGFKVYYDEEGSIGRRYARADEIGIPYAITIDYQTIEDNTVTVRDRDTTTQVRIKIDDLPVYLFKKTYQQ